LYGRASFLLTVDWRDFLARAIQSFALYYRNLLSPGTPSVNVAGSRTKQKLEMPAPKSTPVDPHLQFGATLTRLAARAKIPLLHAVFQ
jgi:hypothetical protein